MERKEHSQRDRESTASAGAAIYPAKNDAEEEFILSIFAVFLSPIPIVGSVFNELRSYQARTVLEARVKTLAQNLREELQQVKEELIDENYLKSEMFFDSLLKATEIAERTRDKRKIELVAQILRGAIVGSEREQYSAEEYLYLMSDLTSQELSLALSLYRKQPQKGQEWDAWKEETRRDPGIDEDDLPMMLGRLEASGLLERVNIISTWGEMETPAEPYYRITSSFRKLMRFLRLDE